MPQLGESVVEGIVVKWFVEVGDRVEAGANLLEVETDKANAEVPATAGGWVARRYAEPGDTVAVGAPLVDLVDAAPGAGAPAPAPAAAPAPSLAPVAPAPVAPAPAPAAPVPTAAPAPAVVAAPSPAPVSSAPAAVPPPPAVPRPPAVPAVPAPPAGATAPDSRPWNSDGVVAGPSAAPPLALALARGSEAPAAPAASVAPPPAAAAPADRRLPFGAPTGFRYFTPPPTTPGEGDTVVKFSRRRGIIAEHMVYSKHVSPHVPCFAEVDMTAVADARKKHKRRLEEQGIPLTILAFVLKATTIALREFPTVNAVVGEDAVILRGAVNLGVAVETDGGLVVPVIRDADKLSVGQLAAAVQEVATKARDKRITVDDLSGGTFTVSNPGRRGNLFGAAIINQPQVGIVRMGEIVRRPVVREIEGEEVICIRSMMFLSLSYDHRVIDGVTGNGFLFRIRELLEAGTFDV